MKQLWIVLILGLITPVMAKDFTIEAYIPVDCTAINSACSGLLEHRGTFDLHNDGASPTVLPPMPAQDPLGDYNLIITHVYDDSSLADGTYVISATLTSVDQAGNESEESSATGSYTKTSSDITPPMVPENLTVK